MRSYFPDDWINHEFPWLEDLVNNEQLSGWRRHSEQETVQSMVSTHAACTGQTAQALDKQRGGVHSKHQCTPLIGWGIEAEAAFTACTSMVQDGRNPWNHTTPVTADLDFAAQQVIQHAPNLLAFRECTSSALEELSVRCTGLDKQLRQHQPPTVRRVAGKISVGLMTVSSLLMHWPDHQLPMRFIVGFQAVGDLEVSHVWRQLDQTTEPVVLY